MTRITQVSRNRLVLSDMQANLSRAVGYQSQLSSGKRVQVMSDDPAAARRALMFRVQEQRNRDFVANIDRSLSMLDATDQALTEMTTVLDEAKTMAVQGATGSQSAASRRALAASVDGLIARMMDLGNTVHDGRFLFGGTEVHTRPFSLDPDGQRVRYHGDLDAFSVAIGPNSMAQVNSNGHALFLDKTDVFASLIDLREALLDDDPQRIGDLIEDLDQVHEHVTAQQGTLGGRMQRLELTRSQLEQAEARLQEQVSREVDADMTEVIMRFQAAQVALEAGLQAGARVMQPSLLDYI